MHVGLPPTGASPGLAGDACSPSTAASSAPQAAPEARRPEPLRLLAVEDNPDDLILIRLALRDARLQAQVTGVDDEPGFLAMLAHRPDIILCDYHLPAFSPQRALALLAERGDPTPLIIVTRAIGEAAAVEVLRLGASDLVSKAHLGTLASVIRRLLEEREIRDTTRRQHDQLTQAHRRMKHLAQRLIDVEESQRRTLGLELHDVLGQELSSLVLHLDAAEREPDSDLAASHRSLAIDLARDALASVRTLSFRLRPPRLEALGMKEAVSTAAAWLLRPNSLHPMVTADDGIDAAPLVARRLVYRVVLEAVANAARHARAGRVLIDLRLRASGRLMAVVADDGVGFDPSPYRGDATEAAEHLGLRGMRERCEIGGARLTIRSAPGRGTVIGVLA